LISAPDKQETKDDECSQQVGINHDRASAKTIGEDAGKRTEDKTGNETSDEEKPDASARTGELKNYRVEGDGVKPIAGLTNYLAQPNLPEGPVAAQ
jgi:hypothetical protein